MYDRFQHLKIKSDGGVLAITFDNPPVNSITKAMHKELAQIFDQIKYDDEAKVVVLTGAGDRTFSAGGDFDALKQSLEDPKGIVRALQEGAEMIHGLLRLDKPVIARINGAAIGLGATLALFCDLTYASDTAKLGDPHVAIGYTAGDGGALIWPQLIGYARAREYLFTGDMISAVDAAAIGLITRAVPADDLDAIVYGMADRLAKSATYAVNSTKKAVNLVLRQQFEAVIEAHLGLELMSHFTDDHAEAVQAFFDKRPPVFRGC